MNNYVKQVLAFSFLLTLAFPALSQKKYWITFSDKDIYNYKYAEHLSPRAIQNRKNLHIPLYQFSDIPVKNAYIDSLSRMGIDMLHKSKWLNSITADLSPKEIKELHAISFIKDIAPVNGSLKITSINTDLEAKSYSLTTEQMQAKAFTKAGLSGEGVVIGVIDAGFYKADREPRLIHLFDEHKILGQKDFLDKGRSDLILTSETSSDSHGKSVLTYLCGYNISERFQSGLAVNAHFYLARSEDGDREYRGEEDSWIEAMEWMDSLGVRLISTSLGYAVNMDDPADNYKKEDMNGKTARISKAAQIAVEEKGMFVVVSAGNEGSSDWQIISAPADAEGVLTVGATEASLPSKIFYSSVGPENLDYLKPNVAVYSPNGTSFSAPAVAGFVACLMQKDSTLTNKEIKAIIEKSSSLYPYGNNFVGYGVPQAERALELLDGNDKVYNNKIISTDKARVELVFKARARRGKAVIFHKKDARNVLSQEIIPVRKRRIVLERKAGEKTTTVCFEDNVIEVVWE